MSEDAETQARQGQPEPVSLSENFAQGQEEQKSFTSTPGTNRPPNWPPAPGELFVQQAPPPPSPPQSQGDDNSK